MTVEFMTLGTGSVYEKNLAPVRSEELDISIVQVIWAIELGRLQGCKGPEGVFGRGGLLPSLPCAWHSDSQPCLAFSLIHDKRGSPSLNADFPMYPPSVAVSAPGKVLFTGGFLVLDRQHTGLVLGLNARIHVHIAPWETSSTNQKGRFLGRGILVQSPQFKDARWLYEEHKTGDYAVVSVTQVVDLEGYSQTPNKFVETTLLYGLTYLSHLSRSIEHSVVITVLADDDYYSENSLHEDKSSQGGFTNFGVKLSEAHKTGLGSSAALTTALVAALSTYTAPSSDDTSRVPLKTIHNLAQAAHCAAQGQVGSGFDVAAAAYGSCVYRRFTPAILEAVGEPSVAGFGEKLHQCVDELNLARKWDVEIASQAVKIPEGLLLLMCDVDCGSETPGMVRNVLKWRKEKPEHANLLWTAIQRGSDDLCQELRRLTELESINAAGYDELSDIIQTIRSLVREMSAKSKVPIEPPVISELLDYCTDLPGVVGGMAPGAGGYDAVALLVKNDEETIRNLRSSLDGWKGKEESGAVIGTVRLLGVKQESEGVKIEDTSCYQEWI